MFEDDDIDLDPPVQPFRGRRLNALIDKWLEDCHVRLDRPDDDGTLNTSTSDGYTNDVVYFRRWWAQVGPGLGWELTPSAMQKFGRWLELVHSQYDRPLSFNQRKDVLRRLKQMFKWAYPNFTKGRDLTDWVPKPNGSAPVRIVVPLDHLRRLKEACYETNKPVQYLAILAVLMDTGMRRAECASLSIEDVEFNADSSGTIKIRRAKRVKGREVQGRLVVFGRFAGKYILAHVDARIAENQARINAGVGRAAAATVGPVFLGEDGYHHMKPDSIYKAIRHLKNLALLDDSFQGPHDLRRRFITTFRQLRRGDSYDHLLQKQTGQLNKATVSQYDLQSIEDVREVFISPFEIMEGNEP